jgi:hypothetical protein
MAKRRERVAPPPTKDGWDFRFGTGDAVTGWEKVCSAAPANARTAWVRSGPSHRLLTYGDDRVVGGREHAHREPAPT